jgi:hypothetical protein
MALKKTMQTSFGFESVDAYHRVEGVAIASKTQISYFLRSYKNNSGVPAFAETHQFCNYDLNGANPIAQAYANAKNLPAMANAVDC